MEAVLIADGEFTFDRAEQAQPFCKGAFVGDMEALMNDIPLHTTLLCLKPGEIYYINRADLLEYISDYPKLQLLFRNRRFVE